MQVNKSKQSLETWVETVLRIVTIITAIAWRHTVRHASLNWSIISQPKLQMGT